VPLSYGKVRINAPLPAKFFSHIRVRDEKESQKGVAVFDITILNEAGLEIVEIFNFVVRKITNTAKMTGDESADSWQLQQAPGVNHGKGDAIVQALIAGVEQGITPAEGVEAFGRVLSGLSPRIIIASQDLNALVDEADSAAKTVQATLAGQSKPAGALHSRPDLPTTFVPAGTQQERRIAEIWQELLGIRQIGIHDDFFELGGHSLMIVSVHSKLQQILDVTFPVAKMFQYPTINALANYLRQGQEVKPSYDDVRDRAERQRARQRQMVKGKSANDQ